MTAQEAVSNGFAVEMVEAARLADHTAELARQLSGHAPLTMWATKESLRRLRVQGLPDDTDIIRAVYGSEDFHSGVRNFLAKRPQSWTGH